MFGGIMNNNLTRYDIWSNVIDKEELEDYKNWEYSLGTPKDIPDSVFEQMLEEVKDDFFCLLKSSLDYKLDHKYIGYMINRTWDGSHTGCHVFSNNLKEILDGDFSGNTKDELYIDEDGELILRSSHHDGVNIVWFRELDDDHDKKWLDKVFSNPQTPLSVIENAIYDNTSPIGDIVKELIEKAKGGSTTEVY